MKLRSLFVATGVLLLTAAFLPQANANFCPPPANCNLIQHFNFNSEANNTAPPLTSVEGGATLINDPVQAFPSGQISVQTPGGTTLNAVGGDPAGGALTVRGNTSGTGKNYCFDISPINVSGLSVVSMSFALKSVGNGGQFTQFTLSFSTNGGTTFTPFASNVVINQDGAYHLYHAEFNPGGATSVVLQACFTGSKNDASPNNTLIDNIEIDAVIPEPGTVASGVLGVVGLCWFQRRRLIRSVRLRRA